MRLPLVEDDPMLGATVCQALRDASHAVDWVEDGRTASTKLSDHAFACVLLDLGLPGRDGLDVLRDLRRSGASTPVIVIKARDALEQRVAGLDAGADDCLAKPFDVAGLLACIRALSRRDQGSGQPMLSNGVVSLDPASKQARVGGQDVPLSGREFALLRELLVWPGAVLSRPELEDRVYRGGEEVESNVVECTIHGLRRKLGSDCIRNVRGLGWMVPRSADTGAGS